VGVFAGMTGKGTIISVVDFNSGTFTGIHDGRLGR
jgi:hypothetical protein